MADPRLQPLAYITDEKRLCEIIRVEPRQNYGLGASPLGNVIAEDCRTGDLLAITRATVLQRWRLVRLAPSSLPDLLEDAA